MASRICYLLVAFALIVAVNGDACDDCKTTYDGASKTTDAEKCTAIKALFVCLETETSKTTGGCKPVNGTVTAIATDFAAIGTCTLEASCTCLKDFLSQSLSTSPIDCTAGKAYAECLGGKTDATPCGGSKTTAQLATGAEAFIGTLTSCSQTGTACQCQIDFAKADIGNDAKKCTENKKLVSCLKGKPGDGCASTVVSLATAAGTVLAGLPAADCPSVNGTACGCELDYASADIGDDDKLCMETRTYAACLGGKTGGTCVTGGTVPSLGMAAYSTLETLGEAKCPLADSACFCEVKYAMADISSNEKKCHALEDRIRCSVLRVGPACDNTTTAMATVASIVTTIGTTTGCSPSTTCTCTSTYLAAEPSCATATTFKTCVDAVTTTEFGCAHSPQAYVKTIAAGLKCEACGSSATGLKAISILALLPVTVYFL